MRRLLLDTHILYWWFYEHKRVSSEAFEVVKNADEVFFSAASIWEIAIKVRLGKMNADPLKIIYWTGQNDFIELPVLSRHGAVVATLPMHHTDPFDRLLVAQAISEPLHLLTVDSKLKPYSELVIQV
jgi:PIN domain nuclease of toxin-antitoxin system